MYLPPRRRGVFILTASDSYDLPSLFIVLQDVNELLIKLSKLTYFEPRGLVSSRMRCMTLAYFLYLFNLPLEY